MSHELDTFFKIWDAEAARAAATIRTIPDGKYDLRPDPNGRSLGELAWHLAELDAYVAFGIARGSLSVGERPPGIERPKTVAELAPGYERIHRASVEQLRGMGAIDLERAIPFFNGQPMPIRAMLWDAILHHHIHHRGQLVLMVRLGGGTPPGLYGPNYEETLAFRAARQTQR